MGKLFQNKAFILGFLSGILIFIGTQFYDSMPESEGITFHAIVRIGFPFDYIETGGNPTYTKTLWFGLFADILIALIFSFVVGLIFKFIGLKIVSRRSPLK